MNNSSAVHTSEPPATLAVGQLLDGKYRVDYRIGQGGMAAVWAGTNERTGKRVALKVLLPTLAAMPGVDSLFQREGTAASRINHPNVVTVFDVIEHKQMACIVMELLDGEPLESFLARVGALSLNDACGLLLPAMRGVAAAHAEGVIHRDLKPANIFVCIGPDGRAVTTKVLDFGISMIMERTREPSTQPLFMGTPSYMAPEQIAGEGGVDERTDVYACGVLFYEALTGVVPFPGDPGPKLYERILRDPVPSLGTIRPDLPPGLVHIIETALVKDPTARHPNVAAMVTAIENELLMAAPMPHSLTPAAGTVIPEAAPRGSVDDGPSRRNAPPAATQMMVGFRLGVDEVPLPARDPTDVLHGRWGRRAAHAVAAVRGSYRSHSRVWLGAAIAVVLTAGVFVFAWPGGRSRTSQGSLSPSVVPSEATAGSTSAEGTARAANVKIEALPGLGMGAGGSAVASEPSTQIAAPSEPSPGRPASREGGRLSASGRGHHGEGRAAAVTSAAKAKKASTPRAGGLSPDDF